MNHYSKRPDRAEIERIQRNHVGKNYGLKSISERKSYAWQLDLLYHHLPNMKPDDRRRAEKTIRTLEQKMIDKKKTVNFR